MSEVRPVSLDAAFAKLTFLPDRKPETTATGWASELAAYRDGGIFVVHYAGDSEWERHAKGDEIVFVFDGETTIVLRMEGREVRRPMQRGDLIVVPAHTWHRFESPTPVKIMTVTPQPTDHSLDTPR